MKKLTLGLMLAAMSNLALASWVEISNSGDGVLSYYADEATIKRAGETAKIWTLINYRDPQTISGDLKYLSVKMEDEVHCADQKTRHLNLQAFSENMGAGKVVGSEKSPAGWRAAGQDSVVAGILKLVCEKK